MAALAYGSDSDSSYDEINPENDEIISDLLNRYRGREIFLWTPIRGLLKVTLGESADPNFPPATFLKIYMVNNNETLPHQEFVRLGDTREDDSHKTMPWYYLVFPETFPDTLYTKASLETKLKGSPVKNSNRVTAANDAYLNRTKANRRNRDVIDLTGEDENNLLKF